MPGLKPVFPKRITQSTTRRTAPIFAQVRFVFWIRPATLNVQFRSTKRTTSSLPAVFAVSVFADSDFVPSHVLTAAILLPQKQGKTRFFAFYVLE
jgi:hypothetical protein